MDYKNQYNQAKSYYDQLANLNDNDFLAQLGFSGQNWDEARNKLLGGDYFYDINHYGGADNWINRTTQGGLINLPSGGNELNDIYKKLANRFDSINKETYSSNAGTSQAGQDAEAAARNVRETSALTKDNNAILNSQAASADNSVQSAKNAEIAARNTGMNRARASTQASQNAATQSTQNANSMGSALRSQSQGTQNDYLNKMNYANSLDQQASNIQSGAALNTIGSALQGAGNGAKFGAGLSDENCKKSPSLREMFDAIPNDGMLISLATKLMKYVKQTAVSDERCKQAENAIEANPTEAAAALPNGSDIQKEAVQAAKGGKDAEVNNQVVDDWYTTQKKKWPQIDNRTLSALWNRDFGMKEPSKESYDAYASTISDERPNGISLPINKFLDYPSIYKSGKGYDEYMKEQRSGLSDEEFESHKANIDDMLSDFQRNYENGSITLSEAVDTIKQLPDDDVYKDDSGMTPRKKAINSIVFDMVYNNESGVRKYFEKLANIYSIRPELFEPYTVSQAQHTEGIFNSLSYVIGLLIDKEQQNNTSKVDPVTAAMNAGLSEDDDDYFTSDERCKQAENAIEANPVEAAQALPQGSAIQKEAVQAIDGGQDAEVNNQVIDAYTKELQNAYGDKFAAYKQNDYMKQMPQDVTLDNLAESDWFKNARKQVGPEYISGNFTYGRQPGFDIDEEWIKANDPNAYKTYGFNDNYGIKNYDEFGKLRNNEIKRDAKDFADFMDEHPELNYSDVISAYGDRYKKATGKDFPMEEFRGYSDKHSEDLNIKKFDKELSNSYKEAANHFGEITDEDWNKIKDDIISYVEQTGNIPGFHPYQDDLNDEYAYGLFRKICEEYGSNDRLIGKKIKEAADKKKAALPEEASAIMNLGLSEDDDDYFTSDENCKMPAGIDINDLIAKVEQDLGPDASEEDIKNGVIALYDDITHKEENQQ